MNDSPEIIDVVTKCNSIVEKNNAILDEISRLRNYILSKKIRQCLESQNQLNQVLLKIEGFSPRIEIIIQIINTLLQEIKGRRGIFVQRKHYREVKHLLKDSKYDLLEVIINLKEVGIRIRELPGKKQLVETTFIKIEKLIMGVGIQISNIVGRLELDHKILASFNDITRTKLNLAQLQTGDVVAQITSPKTVSQKIISKVYSTLKESEVGHILFIVRVADRIMYADYIGTGFRYRTFKVRPENIYIVLRPRSINLNQRMKMLRSVQNHIKDKNSYSHGELMGAYAVLIFTKIFNLLRGRFTSFSNPVPDPTGSFFCSEFVNEVYREAGIYLTPKSRYSNTVMTSDILHSSYLFFLGLLFDDSEKTQLFIQKKMSNIEL